MLTQVPCKDCREPLSQAAVRNHSRKCGFCCADDLWIMYGVRMNEVVFPYWLTGYVYRKLQIMTSPARYRKWYERTSSS